MGDHLVPLAGDWALWRDFAVRSAGFPVDGLNRFGPEDEPQRLVDIAADPQFQEALTWQNREALETAARKLSVNGSKPSKRRQREELVATYWQRYCAKNDTIGFFGPLAWGQIVDDGPAVKTRSGGLVRSRSVHFEVWAIELLARAIGADVGIAMGPWPERDLRAGLEEHADAAVRDRGLAALDRIERARDAVADADPEHLGAALVAFDSEFAAAVGGPPVRDDSLSGGGRTPLYLDCMRDLDAVVGPVVVDELARTLPALLESARWYCGRSFAHGRALLRELVPPGRQPLAPLYGRIIGTLVQRVPELLADDLKEVQRRWAILLADGDVDTLSARARDAFSDHGPAWPMTVFHSVDVQIAAADEDAIERGEFLAVAGDFHAGGNPLGQGLFAHQHPERDRFLKQWDTEWGSPKLGGLPPRAAAGIPMTARLYPAFFQPDDILILPGPDVAAPRGHRALPLSELFVDGDEVTDARETFRAPLTHVVFVAMFLPVVMTFEPFPVSQHDPRLTISRTVLRRETWRPRVGDCPTEPDAVAAWAHDRGMPRRVFCRMPGERKPTYLDVESPVLTRLLCRRIRRAQRAGPDHELYVTEMLPGPDECWLEQDGERFTSELRLVAVDTTRRGGGTVAVR
jgi:hypothetical protein